MGKAEAQFLCLIILSSFSSEVYYLHLFVYISNTKTNSTKLQSQRHLLQGRREHGSVKDVRWQKDRGVSPVHMQ